MSSSVNRFVELAPAYPQDVFSSDHQRSPAEIRRAAQLDREFEGVYRWLAYEAPSESAIPLIFVAYAAAEDDKLRHSLGRVLKTQLARALHGEQPWDPSFDRNARISDESVRAWKEMWDRHCGQRAQNK